LNTAVHARAAQSGGRRVPLWALALPVVVVLVVTAAGIAEVLGGRNGETVWVGPGHARLGGAAPGFTSWDLGGKKVGLTDFHGRTVLLSFWATWCTACRDEMPALQALRDRYTPEGFAVLAVNFRETSTDRMRRYLTGINVDLQALVDPDGAIASAYGVDIGLPVNVFIDTAGKVVGILLGETPAPALQQAIEKALAA
jgi:cytochrome c biogenesis protein CcmG/thiol:disulfide interchange protein DsbE